MVRTLVSLLLVGVIQSFALGQSDVSEARMDLMAERVMQIRFFSDDNTLPKTIEAKPLFRYDDVPRGYVDGTVWRWGKKGRPQAIITAELHPKYGGTSPRVVYDFLSLSKKPFSAKSPDVSWTPSTSAVEMKRLDVAPQPADTPSKRLFQMKQIMKRMTASQIVSREDPEERKLNLRLLARPIDRYRDETNPGSDGAVFLFVAGTMPGVIVFLETDGEAWRYGVGRLSAPSTLVLAIDDAEVWKVPPDFGSWSDPYTASNSPAVIPGT